MPDGAITEPPGRGHGRSGLATADRAAQGRDPAGDSPRRGGTVRRPRGGRDHRGADRAGRRRLCANRVALLPEQGKLREPAAAGIDAIAASLRAWRPDRPLEDALERAATTGDPSTPTAPAQDPGADETDPDRAGPARRLAPGARRGERVFARALADRAGLPAVDLRSEIQAAMLNSALRTAVEHYAWRTDEEQPDPAVAEAELVSTVRSALAVARQGLA